VVAENSPTPVEALPARRQNTGDQETTSAPEKSAATKPKPAAAAETSKPRASKPEASKAEASKSGANQGESSSNNVGITDFAALLNKQMEEFKNMMISTQQQMATMIEKIQAQSEA